ncbi:MAG TPA: sterol desaturase family protein [Polyangia bacterium]|jgi:sterol desaturase/sphingolipid hydroxylase (fatty acid hydroxylase superfamily)|nr:sterol desaturase family protein [Polyangia bacterium]
MTTTTASSENTHDTESSDSSANARTELIRKLGSSTFNYWFGYVANLSLVAWLVSHAFVHGRPLLGRFELVAFAATGLVAWTLAEWLLHRYIYHLWTSFLTEGHALHHARPRALIGVPWYLTTIALVAFYELLAHLLRPSSTGVVMGFAWLGYVFYCIAHHGSHHWRLQGGWLKKMKRHHLLHHAHPEYNWGFTTPLWDWVFGTHYDRARRAGGPRR